MHVSHLTLLVAGVCVYFANPLVAAVAAPGPTLAIHPSVADTPDEPTCIEPGVKSASSNHDLGSFADDCYAAANDFFGMGPMSRIAWRFARNPAGGTPAPGSMPLPFLAGPYGCMVQLDVLDDPNAWDRFALIQIFQDYNRIIVKCIQPQQGVPASGFVAVGPKKVLKLTVSPIPMHILLESASILNGTGLQS